MTCKLQNGNRMDGYFMDRRGRGKNLEGEGKRREGEWKGKVMDTCDMSNQNEVSFRIIKP